MSTFIAGKYNRFEVYTAIKKGGKRYETPILV
jgi:hypothetical protein